ncbi:5'/3'-nucleotidase SurE [Aquisediminimonas sediminicola]|uniref:5'/3'-nucleotidase SurE n=1 Tax=Alteraquisediminimonas sediminicola TaxID=2676787 RepID=UPI001C8D3D57|nr:5'/3'-nucleotidase SurE [Aquisediminimonas sediminicola]
MRILVTNDDGIHAPGLALLERIAHQFSDDVWVIAPAEEQSGAGHSLTLSRPVRLRSHGLQRYSVTGTPTDCIMMAVGHVMQDCLPDLILSGINRGANLAEDLTYSGTVSAAMEGALAGIRSIALSQQYLHEAAADSVSFSAAEAWAARVIAPLLDQKFDHRTLVNINFPPVDADQVHGVRVVRQGFRDYGRLRLVKGTDPRGYDYFWFGLGEMIHTPMQDTDLEAVADRFVSVTPVQLDLTHYEVLDQLRALYS